MSHSTPTAIDCNHTDVDGERVLDIEYDREAFAAACEDAASPASVVLRDRDLVTPDDPGFLFATCPGAG